ncbi:MAG: TldD/PmbA family protein [Oscillospiraceae bacterium]|jgi:TldD protein|nr:TldD/PmbA family protein [Oscillospiraceae bacterium]
MTPKELTAALGGIADYAEVRAQTNTSTAIQMLNGNLTVNTVNTTGGVSARVNAGMWGFASAPEQTAESVKTVLDAARRNALFLSGKTGRKGPELHTGFHAKGISVPRKEKPHASAADKLGFIRALDSYIQKKYPALVSRHVVLSGITMEKTVAVSGGAEAHTFLPRTTVYVQFSAEGKEGAPVDLMMEPAGGGGEYEDLFGDPAALYGSIDECYESLMKKREGVRPEGGVKTCVLAPDLAGILAHEAVGHTVECDLVRGGSVAGKLLNQTVASEKVSITDFAHTAFGQACPIPVYADDEGVEARDAVLIDKGVLKGYMHNRRTAYEYGAEPAGNARAFAFSDEPLIRMRNTCILPGSDKLADLIASVEDGYYLSHPTNGQADMTGEFMFGVGLGFEIKNGKLGRALTDTTVSGVAFEMLKTVTGVSDDLQWIASGTCGKKQMMVVGMGGPAVLCRINVGGE